MAEVVNMVASQRVCSFIDVNEVSYVLNIDYEREQFPGLVYRINNPKVCILLFRSGKAVATGARNKQDIETAFKMMRDDLRKNEFDLFEEKEIITHYHNIVVTSDFSAYLKGSRLNLTNLVFGLPFQYTEYEPEQFPGLIYKNPTLGVVCLIFSSGRCVITGSKTYEVAVQAEDMLKALLMPFMEGKFIEGKHG
jgi:transcription initiation factor TFIID TATA-box-binding protein